MIEMVLLKCYIFLSTQGCYCERLITPGNQHSNGLKSGKEDEKMVNVIKIIIYTSIFGCLVLGFRKLVLWEQSLQTNVGQGKTSWIVYYNVVYLP